MPNRPTRRPVTIASRTSFRRSSTAQAGPAGLFPFVPSGGRRIDRTCEPAFAQLAKEDRTSEQVLEHRDGEAALQPFVRGHGAASLSDLLVEGGVAGGGRRGHLRGRDFLLAQDPAVAEGLQVPCYEEAGERLAVFVELLRQGTDRPFLRPEVGDHQVAQILLRNERRPSPRGGGNRPDNK